MLNTTVYKGIEDDNPTTQCFEQCLAMSLKLALTSYCGLLCPHTATYFSRVCAFASSLSFHCLRLLLSFSFLLAYAPFSLSPVLLFKSHVPFSRRPSNITLSGAALSSSVTSFRIQRDSNGGVILQVPCEHVFPCKTF